MVNVCARPKIGVQGKQHRSTLLPHGFAVLWHGGKLKIIVPVEPLQDTSCQAKTVQKKSPHDIYAQHRFYENFSCT